MTAPCSVVLFSLSLSVLVFVVEASVDEAYGDRPRGVPFSSTLSIGRMRERVCVIQEKHYMT